MIGDHELRLPRPHPGGLREAGRDEGTAAAGAAVGADRELGPERLRRLEGELGSVAGLGLVEPGLEGVPARLVAGIAQQHRPEARELLAAHVVLPALQHGDRDLPAERQRRSRDVLGQQLALERLGRRGDNHPPAGLERRQQIRQALAGARPGLCDEMLPRGKRGFDGGGERGLLGPGLEAGKGRGERSARGKRVVHGAAA